ncbi:MAG TPA: hypothetical protein VEW72_07015, partial [Burkholderiales bacterium]|nr:hypothetical protein [Burkholderiales bacterium]
MGLVFFAGLADLRALRGAAGFAAAAFAGLRAGEGVPRGLTARPGGVLRLDLAGLKGVFLDWRLIAQQAA